MHVIVFEIKKTSLNWMWLNAKKKERSFHVDQSGIDQFNKNKKKTKNELKTILPGVSSKLLKM